MQDTEIARHIASCAECRDDFAVWISTARSLEREAEKIPRDVVKTMFEKLPDQKTELEKIVESGSYNMAFDIIRYAFQTVKSTFRLASLF